jgi:hypothetical protein
MSLAENMGMRPLVAHCHFGLGSLYSRVDRPLDARKHAAAAAAMYREMGMEYWLGTATAASDDERNLAAADGTPTSRAHRLAE